jgi:hypothetical protein
MSAARQTVLALITVLAAAAILLLVDRAAERAAQMPHYPPTIERIVLPGTDLVQVSDGYNVCYVVSPDGLKAAC